MAKQLYAECLRASSIRHNNRMAASCLFPLLLLESGSKQVACFKSLLLTMKVIPNPGMPANLMDIFSSLSQLTELAEEAANLMKTEDVFNDAPCLATVAKAALSSYALLFGDYKKAKELWTDLQRQRCFSEKLFEGESACLLGSNYTLALFLQGHIKAARSSLQSLKLSFREHELSRHWRKCEASMNFTSSFFKQDNANCKDNLVKLATFCPLEAKLKECALLLSNGELRECQRLLIHIRNDCEEKRIYLFRWLLLAAEAAAYQNCDSHRMSYYLSTLKQISIHQKDTNTSALIGLLEAIIHLLRGDADQLVHIALDALLKLSETGTAFEQGQCRFLLGIGYLMKARKVVENEEKERMLITSVEDMTEAASLFSLVKAPYHEKVALWYLAQTYHALGRWQLRNENAEAFLALDEAHPGDCHMQFLAKALLLPKY
ncbi:hypothetical protein M514_13088 [Trichuris suis]|nr:hypothetical protein M514_13088 [Trichuris suis]